MNLREKLAAGQEMDVRAQERAHIAYLEANIDAVSKALNLAQRMQSLSSASGFSDMLNAIKEVQKNALSKMLRATDPYEVARLQGGVNAFKDIIRVMSDNGDRIKELDIQLSELHDQRSSIVRPTENE